MSTFCRKLDASVLEPILDSKLARVVSAFENEGYEIRLVGGVVRDLLLGQACQDMDLSTDATPDDIIRVFKKHKIHYIETGLQHGTITAHVSGQNFEVTTLRADVETDGRHAVVEFVKDWRLDAERRDLTINSMSLSIDGTLYDYFEGEKDLAERRVRFVGDPRLRIKEDFLRILRYFRFHGRISMTEDSHDPTLLRIIEEQCSGLRNVAVERIWVELSKIVVGNFAPSLLRIMNDLGVLRMCRFPEVTPQQLQEFTQVWSHSWGSGIQPAAILAALVDHVNHAESLGRDLKLSNHDRCLCVFVVGNRMVPRPPRPDVKRYKVLLVNQAGRPDFKIWRERVMQLLAYEGYTDAQQELLDWPLPAFPLTGNHLMQAGLASGPQLGVVLNKLKNLWVESDFMLSKDDLLARAKNVL